MKEILFATSQLYCPNQSISLPYDAIEFNSPLLPIDSGYLSRYKQIMKNGIIGYKIDIIGTPTIDFSAATASYFVLDATTPNTTGVYPFREFPLFFDIQTPTQLMLQPNKALTPYNIIVISGIVLNDIPNDIIYATLTY